MEADGHFTSKHQKPESSITSFLVDVLIRLFGDKQRSSFPMTSLKL